MSGDTTCVRPVCLSEIGIDTPEWTEFVSELQMEATHGGRGGVELLSMDFFQGYVEK